MRRALIAAVAAAVLVLSACGGGGGGSGSASGPSLTKAEYQKKLVQIGQSIAGGLKDSNSKNVSKADVDQVVAVFRAFADRLEAVNPPAAIRDLHKRLIQAMNDFGDEFPDIADKVNKAQKQKDPSEAIAALFGANAVQELVKLGTEFKTKGYDFNLSGQTTTTETD